MPCTPPTNGQPVPEVPDRGDMQNHDQSHQHGQWFVVDPPEIEDLFGLCQIGDSTDQECTLRDQRNSFPQGRTISTLVAGGAAKAKNGESKADLAEEKPEPGGVLGTDLGCLPVEGLNPGPNALWQLTRLHRCSEYSGTRSKLVQGQFLSTNRPRNSYVKVAPDKARQHHDDHRPVGDRDEPIELERRVECDQCRTENPTEYVEFQQGKAGQY